MFDFNNEGSSGVNGSKVTDRVLEYLFRMIPLGEKQRRNILQRGSKVIPESPRRKRNTSVADSDESFEDTASSDEPLEIVLDIDWAFEVVLPMLQEGELDLSIANMLVESAGESFSKEGLLVDLEFEEGVETVVVGDIHGQFTDLLLIFEKFGRPGPNRRYIFNGDVVDRGPRSVACWLFLCALKTAIPEYLYITRGNHETRTISVMHSSFAHECIRFYSQSFYLTCQKVFDELPLAYTLNKSIFITHGGLPQNLCLDKMRKMPKNALDPRFDQELAMALLWNDPSMIHGYGSNNRGPRVFSFGPDITQGFLQKHNFSLLIRSHEYKIFGYQYTHLSKCLTIFSCPDYQNLGNSGAVALVDFRGNVKIEQFD